MKSVLWRVAKRLSHIEDARCLKVILRSALSWVLRQRGTAASYPLLGPTHQSRLQRSKMGPTGCRETSVMSYRSTLRRNPKERRSVTPRRNPEST